MNENDEEIDDLQADFNEVEMTNRLRKTGSIWKKKPSP